MTAAHLRDAIRTIQALRTRLDAAQADRAPPIAIIGLGCRFPGADGPDALWHLLATGTDAVSPIPADRWDNASWFSPDPDAPGRIAFREAAFLDDVDGFDNDLFGIAAREAATMDPQHRLLLETAWSALAHACQRPETLHGSRTGVFLGLNGGDHLHAALAVPELLGSHALAGGVASIAAGRIAYGLGLAGPAIVVDTACSSSLVAVHLAVQALRSGECSMALAGGVHLMLGPAVSVALSRARMMAPDGRCKPFDAAADGFGQGEGAGIVVLKRLADALAAHDPVLAVIRGSALNQDGRSAGITAPSLPAQQAVIRAALADARLEPDAIDAIEAHGTGTALGDPIEMHALRAVFADRTRPLAIGAAKSNIGHAAAAAGVAGLIKAVLMLRHQAVPGVLHFRRLNPHIDLAGTPLLVPATLTPMPLGCVGVSSFGFSGTNAHVVLHAAPPDALAEPGPPLIFQRRRFPRRVVAHDPAPLFPGRLLDSPSADRQLECLLDPERLPWLRDHRVQGRMVVPGAVLLALMLAVAPPGAALAGIAFAEPVVLDEAPVRLVALARPDGGISVSSRSDAGGAGATWTEHASAGIAAPATPLDLPPAAPPGPPPGPPPGAPSVQWLGRAGWVAHLAALGIDIGPAFQGIARIAPGELTLAALEPVCGPSAGPFHPALLDAALQVAGGTLPAEPVLPVGIARFTLHAPLAGALSVRARRCGDSIDLLVLDGDRPVASVQGLAVRRLADAVPPTFAVPVWVAADSPPACATPARVIRVAPDGANLAEALHAAQQNEAPLALLLPASAADDPGAAALAGLATALAAEQPGRGVRCIAPDPGTPEALLRAELAGTGAEPLVALRAHGRFVLRLHRAAVPAAAPPRLSGTVLITGGLGGVGRQCAAWAAARGAEALLLVGRTAGTPPAFGALPVRCLAADIADPGACAQLQAALAGLPPLRTVIHTAGVLRDGLIAAQTPEHFAATLAPKLAGARTLHALTEHRELDHFLLFGSVASLIGAAGQASYAAANAALDAFALWRRARGLPAISIAWGRWAGAGMASGLTEAQAARVSARGLPAMPPGRALAALDAAIALDAPNVVIAAFDWARFAATAPPAFADLLPPTAPAGGTLPEQVAGILGEILGQPAPPGRALVACGLDSLMAVDLRNRLNRRFGTALRLAELMEDDAAALIARVQAAVAAAAEEEVLTL